MNTSRQMFEALRTEPNDHDINILTSQERQIIYMKRCKGVERGSYEEMIK